MSAHNPTHSALLQRPASSPVARLTRSLNKLSVNENGLAVSQNAFLNHVDQLAQALPEHQHVVNLCDNRYLFLVTLCAVIVRGSTNLLPPNKNVSTQAKLSERYDQCLAVHDGTSELAEALEQFNVSELNWALDEAEKEIPQIHSELCAVISFTSGSTGESKPNVKYWRTLVESSKINAQYMLIDPKRCHSHLATVPGQHMWGFETSVLLPMFANVTLVDARPFFPHDIIEQLNSLPAPRTLISAPLHLKTLSATLSKPGSASNQAPINLSSILCATAPLAPELASELEQLTQCQLREVYGCSEVGSMAVRETARDQHWTPFLGLDFQQTQTNSDSDQHSSTQVSASHLPTTITLEDTLIFNADSNFRLAGRHSDQIKIAGKRGSLGEVNAVLNKFNDLLDGVALFPEQTRAIPRLVALVALKEGTSTHQLRTYMAQHLDAAFVPRPILEVKELPREENGKLSKSKALELYQKLIARN